MTATRSPVPQYTVLDRGDPAPDFLQAANGTKPLTFNVLGGRYVLLCFFGTMVDEQAKAACSLAHDLSRNANRDLAVIAVSNDPADVSERGITALFPSLPVLFDFDGSVARLYGALPASIPDNGLQPVRRLWVLADPMQRIRAVVPIHDDQGDLREIGDMIAALPPASEHAGFAMSAPVIVLPNVFEPEFCAELIALYEAHGGTESGFMVEENGVTVGRHDRAHKSRKDCMIEDEALKLRLQKRVQRRIVPEVAKVHQFAVTRMERYLIGCYDAESGGHFRAHRDNTTKGTAHRRFAVSINLNDEFEGGRLSFPEYGPQSIRLPAGAACVFSCSLLHQVSPVSSGRRYAFLPFIYDDAAAAIREANNAFLDASVGDYSRQAKSA